jgi:hypothetical protein
MKIRGRKLGDCTCDYCGQLFQKPISEIKRNSSLGRRNFCSRICVGKNNVNNLMYVKSDYDISQHANNRKDEYTKFRYHFRNIGKRNKEVDVTLEDLKSIWETQNGKCTYLGIDLVLSNYSKIQRSPVYSASLDRIDSTKGYIKGNIQWISRAMNNLKNDMSHEDMLEIINLIKKGS